MNYTVGTLQELVEVISQVTEQSTIKIVDYITIDEKVEINNDNVIYIDLNDNTVEVLIDSAFTINGGEIWFTNGIIDGNCNNLISIEGTATVVLYDNLNVSNTGTIATVGKKGQMFINGAEIHCDSESPAIFVEGYTRALANSKLTMMTGYITSVGTTIEVTKRGIVEIQEGNIYSNSGVAISKGDDTATIVSVTGGLFNGTIPEGSVDTNNFIVTNTNDGYFSVSPKEENVAEDSVVLTQDDSPVDSSVEEPTDAVSEDVIEPEVASVEKTSNEVSVEPAEDTVDTTPVEESKETVELVVEPTPEPEVILAPRSVNESEEVQQVNEVKSTSTILKKPTKVYVIPNHAHLLTTIIGAVNILGGEFTDPKTMEVYTKVSFKLPGNGKKAIGYVVASNLGGAK